jgi:hypothetical protein
MKKMSGFFLFAYVMLAPVALAFAETTTNVGEAAKVSFTSSIVSMIVPILFTIATAVLGLLAQFLKNKVTEVKSSNKAAWLTSALTLAGAAVRAAEAKYGPDTTKGAAKKQEAVDFLTKHVPGLDSKTASDFVEAAYADAFLIASPLAQAPGSKPSTT